MPLNSINDTMIPIYRAIVNSSLSTGIFPNDLKCGGIKPILKKPSLDPDVLSNYRPVTNIPFLSKIIEKFAAAELAQYLHDYDHYDPLQSAYRKLHSTESASLKIHNDIMLQIDKGNCVLSVFLDLSAAFDTISHSVLINRLCSIGVHGTALSWFKSYMTSRKQAVYINNSSSSYCNVDYGVPQGSTLGPILFLVYMRPLGEVIKQHSITYHMFADDTQLHIRFKPNIEQCSNAKIAMETCIGAVHQWLSDNGLFLNSSKTLHIH